MEYLNKKMTKTCCLEYNYLWLSASYPGRILATCLPIHEPLWSPWGSFLFAFGLPPPTTRCLGPSNSSKLLHFAHFSKALFFPPRCIYFLFSFFSPCCLWLNAVFGSGSFSFNIFHFVDTHREIHSGGYKDGEGI